MGNTEKYVAIQYCCCLPYPRELIYKQAYDTIMKFAATVMFFCNSFYPVVFSSIYIALMLVSPFDKWYDGIHRIILNPQILQK